MDDDSRITAVEEVPDDSTFLFTVEDGSGEQREAILVRRNGTVACWLNHCQHMTHIKLDKGTGAPIRDGEIVCTNHGAMFEKDSGYCTFGPCEGAYLDEVEVTVSEGDVYLTDSHYRFVHEGPLEGDDWDLSSSSNIEF